MTAERPTTERLREALERDARFQDALDALQTATLWVNGSWPSPSADAAESWRRKARSGIVALREALAAAPMDRDPTFTVVEGHNHTTDGLKAALAAKGERP